MRRRQGSTAGPALPACRGEGRPRRPRHPSQRSRGPPRKLSCTCRSPRPGSRERRRTPTLSAMEPVAGSAALLGPAPPGVTQAPTRPARSAARSPPRRPTGLAALAGGHGGAAPAAPPSSAPGQPGWLWAGDGPCGATGRSPPGATPQAGRGEHSGFADACPVPGTVQTPTAPSPGALRQHRRAGRPEPGSTAVGALRPRAGKERRQNPPAEHAAGQGRPDALAGAGALKGCWSERGGKGGNPALLCPSPFSSTKSRLLRLKPSKANRGRVEKGSQLTAL